MPSSPGDARSRLREFSRRQAGRAARPWVMGVLNVTPDSFSDGGEHEAPEAWRARVDAMLDRGADVVDVGGESTRPGARAVPAQEQCARVLPAIEHAARERRAVVSIDTTLPSVADAALAAGATIVNDVSCLADVDLARVAARHDAALILMHSRGAMSDMRGFGAVPEGAYADVVAEVRAELEAAVARAVEAGVPRERVMVDPGLGFHKSAAHSLELLRRVDALVDLAPVVVGASRKSFLTRGEARPPKARLGASLAAAVWAAERGAAMVRVHDVPETVDALGLRHALGGP